MRFHNLLPKSSPLSLEQENPVDSGVLNTLSRTRQEQTATEAIEKSRLVIGVGHHHMTGMRLTNEDEILVDIDHQDDAWAMFAIFDGHGGDFTAGYLRRHFAARFRAALRKQGGGLSQRISNQLWRARSQ